MARDDDMVKVAVRGVPRDSKSKTIDTCVTDVVDGHAWIKRIQVALGYMWVRDGSFQILVTPKEEVDEEGCQVWGPNDYVEDRKRDEARAE